MRRLVLIAMLGLAAVAGAQTFTTTDATVVQAAVNPFAMVINVDQFNSEVLKNGIILNPGFEKPEISILVQAGNSNLGSATYFVSFNDFSIVPTNEASSNSATAQVWRNGAIICNAPVVSNNQGDSNAARWLGVLSGTALTIQPLLITATVNAGAVTLAIFNSSIAGVADGTYALIFLGGSPSVPATGTYTVTGGVVTGTNLTNAGTGYGSAPTVIPSSPATSMPISGIPNGTYNLEVHSGSGSGGTATMTVTGATLGGSGYTGGTATVTVTAAGSYTTAPKINIWNGYTLGACTTGTWTGGATVGDFVNLRWDYGTTTQAQFNAMGWGFNGAGSAVGSSDVPTGDLPPGTQNGQSIQVIGPMTVSTAFDTGEPGGQNLYQMVDPIASEISCKETSGSGALSYSITRTAQAGGGAGWNCSGTLTCTGSWQKFTSYATTGGNTCTTGETVGSNTGATGQVTVSYTVPSGSTILLDDALVAGHSTGNASAFRDEVVTTLAAYGGGSRLLDNQMPMPMADQLQPDTRGVHSYTFGDNCNNGQPMWSAGCVKAPPITIPMHLNLCAQLSIDCWDVVGVDLTGTEAQTLADYLGGSCSVGYPTCTCGTTGAATRCQQNHSASYTSQFAGMTPKRQMHFELGNENWNLGSSGGKWRNVPTCTAGANCAAEYANGTSESKPYGLYVQNFASNFQGRASYDATTEVVNFGAQMSGSNTTFALDNLFKAGGTSTPGTPFVTAAVNINYAPYIDFTPTQTGFDTADYSNQIQSDLANAYWNTNNASGSLHLPVAAYSNQADIYEVNGGQTGNGFAAITQPQETGYQNSMGEGVAEVINVMEACRVLGICKFSAYFVLQQQQQDFGATVQPTLSGTSANGSNVLTGVTVTSDMVVGSSVSGPGFGSSVDGTGTSLIWAIGGSSLTMNKNISCSTTCHANTYTLTRIVTNLWGGAIGMGAQRNNSLRAPLVYLQALNAAIPYGSQLTLTASSGIPSTTYPPTGNCGTSSNTAHALVCNGAFGDNPTPNTLSGIPLLYAWSLKGNAASNSNFRGHVYLNADNASHTFIIASSPLSGRTVTQTTVGVGNNWRDSNELTVLVAPATTTASMPPSLTLSPGEMVVLTGTLAPVAASSTTLTGGVTLTGGATIH